MTPPALPDRDRILREMLQILTRRGITSSWANEEKPHTALLIECQLLMAEPSFAREVREYLAARTAVRRAVRMLITQMSSAATLRPDQVPEFMRPIVSRGWFLGRWIPTFLVVDGPVGRFIMGDRSPLKSRFTPDRPALCAARDIVANKTFHNLRNGFAHWAFDWEVSGQDSYVVAYDFEKDLPIAKLHQQEADAFHMVAYALTEILANTMIDPRTGEVDAA